MFNENEKLAVKQTLNTKGWDLIDFMFREELIEGKKITTFNTEGKSNEAIAREVSAKEMAGKTIDKLLKRLNSLKVEQEVKKITYK